jgi:hypothetical protein
VKNEARMQESYDLVSEQFRLGLEHRGADNRQDQPPSSQATVLQSKYTALYNCAMLAFYQGQSIAL